MPCARVPSLIGRKLYKVTADQNDQNRLANHGHAKNINIDLLCSSTRARGEAHPPTYLMRPCEAASRQDGLIRAALHTSFPISRSEIGSDGRKTNGSGTNEKRETEDGIDSYRHFSAPERLTYTSDLPVMLQRILTKYLPALPINPTTHHQRTPQSIRYL